ncbi:hypothetical protein ROA7450_00053 [Roseovarius albus]|uniref:Uncharacterized protein n=1 Tax=Roseovarius albus TaxID=1247867 RepID=A0A1X6Y765_9RHOB|nr:hypothetical protein [Roseovarius albus]SLN11022.1 hypothetical protein ROA7450_00053 [Roseovarius albus]
MRWLWKWLKRIVLVVALVVVGLALPVGYNELACVRKPVESEYAAILPPDQHRAESRTLLTYPEWHIVHAYDDYAKVIETGDPHEFGYWQAVRGFWSSLCELSYASADHGGFPGETKQMVYVIGVSFTAELLAKAAYEETLGRVTTWLRGEERAPLDNLSALQSADYANFLQQVPWYKWDFRADAAALKENASGASRDTERRLALGLEYKAKAAYAGVIEQAVSAVGADELRLRMIVSGLPDEVLTAMEGVKVVAQHAQGTEIETPRYRELTYILKQMADEGVEFVEIAGNDDIMFTAISAQAEVAGAIHSFARQGYGDHRHLIMVRVGDLASTLREMDQGVLWLEHIHDY